MLKLCLSITSFQFNGKHDELTDGLPIGSAASPVIANLFMTKLEEKAIKSYDGQKPKIWFRFVDDVLSIVRVDEVEKLLGHISANINFTKSLI